MCHYYLSALGGAFIDLREKGPERNIHVDEEGRLSVAPGARPARLEPAACGRTGRRPQPPPTDRAARPGIVKLRFRRRRRVCATRGAENPVSFLLWVL